MRVMKDIHPIRVRLLDKMILLGIGLSLFYWAIETILHKFVLHLPGEFTEHLFPTDPDELSVRLLTVTGIMVFSVFAQNILAKRKKAQEELRRQSEFLETTIESLTHPFYVLDADDFTIKIANSATKKLFGDFPKNSTCYAVTHRRGEPCGDLDHPCPLKEVKQSKKGVMVEHIHYDEDGSPRHYEVHCHPIFDNEGNVVQAIEYTLDITERKQAQEALERAHEEIKEAYNTLEQAQATAITSEKLAAVGRLTSGVSHEVLNPSTSSPCASRGYSITPT